MKYFKKIVGDRIYLSPKGVSEEEVQKPPAPLPFCGAHAIFYPDSPGLSLPCADYAFVSLP